MLPRNIAVELNAPQGAVFSGTASSIELRTTGGVIAITPDEDSYLSMIHTTEITLRVDKEFKTFTMRNGAASLRSGVLTILAEEIIPKSR